MGFPLCFLEGKEAVQMSSCGDVEIFMMVVPSVHYQFNFSLWVFLVMLLATGLHGGFLRGPHSLLALGFAVFLWLTALTLSLADLG